MYRISDDAQISVKCTCLEPLAAHMTAMTSRSDTDGIVQAEHTTCFTVRDGHAEGLKHIPTMDLGFPCVDGFVVTSGTPFTAFIAACPSGTSAPETQVEAFLRTVSLLPPVSA